MEQEIITRCKHYLMGRHLTLRPQNSACRLTIIVPVHDETTYIIKQQVSSIERQQGITPSEIEVLYIINNDRIGTTAAEQTIGEHNAAVLRMLFDNDTKDTRVRSLVIDASSPGQEIEECNVGKARNLGLYIAAERFAERGQNGVLMHTDADTFFEDKYLLQKILDRFAADKRLIGATGGRTFIMPTLDNPDWELLKPVFQKLLTVVRCKALLSFLSGELTESTFRDANMLSRAYESVMIGGFQEVNSEEDVRLGLDLAEYAARHGQYVRGFKHEWLVTSLLRLSSRTDNNNRPLVERLRAGNIPRGQHPFSQQELQLTEQTYAQLRKEVLHYHSGQSFIDYFEKLADVRLSNSELRGY